MGQKSRSLVSVLCAWAALGAGSAFAQFAGELTNGTMFSRMHLSPWDATNPPRLMQHQPEGPPQTFAALLDPRNPVRWMVVEVPDVSGQYLPPRGPKKLRNLVAADAPGEPEVRIEFFGGDRLPGRVLEYQNGGESHAEAHPANLLVKPDWFVAVPPGSALPEQPNVRVIVENIKRIVWQSRARAYTPSVIHLADGRQLAFRRVRWSSSSVTLLLEDGTTRSVPFTDIAELHLPRRDPWLNYCQTLARLTPDCTGRLMRIETVGGMTATTTVERLRFRGNDAQLIQPAWSLDPIWTPINQIVMRRFTAPHEVPLSIIDPVRVTQESPLGGVQPWQTDRSVKGRTMRCGGRSWGWGFGVHAQNVLEFELPSMVRAFQTRVGLDEEVLRGGCARAQIFANAAQGAPLWQSKVLLGSKEVIDSGLVVLSGPAGGQKTLLLVADMAHADRPSGADPLNIRDMVDWMQPMLELDPQKLATEVARVIPDQIPAWTDWNATLAKGASFVPNYRWDEADGRELLTLGLKGGNLLLARELDIGDAQNFLVLSLLKFTGAAGSSIEVRVDGKPLAQFDVPELWNTLAAQPRLVSLRKFRGKTVKIEIEAKPSADGAVINWRSIGFSAGEQLGEPLKIIQATSTQPNSVMTIEPGGNLHVGNTPGTNTPEFDTYTIVAETSAAAITGFRLELIPDRRNNSISRGSDHKVVLTEFKVSIAPLDKPGQSEPVTLVRAAADVSPPNEGPTNPIDAVVGNGWSPTPTAMAHAAVFMADRPVGFPAGTRITFTLENKPVKLAEIGRLRLSTISGGMPMPVPRPADILPPMIRGKMIFEDASEFANLLNAGTGIAVIDLADKHTANTSLKVTLAARANPSMFTYAIREKPAAEGEFRYIRFAWKKTGGQAIGIQIAHDARFGPDKDKPATFRYQAGGGPQIGGAATVINPQLPENWVVVTRDLFADFGEFNFTGLSFDAVDGDSARYDGMYLGKTLGDIQD